MECWKLRHRRIHTQTYSRVQVSWHQVGSAACYASRSHTLTQNTHTHEKYCFLFLAVVVLLLSLLMLALCVCVCVCVSGCVFVLSSPCFSFLPSVLLSWLLRRRSPPLAVLSFFALHRTEEETVRRPRADVCASKSTCARARPRKRENARLFLLSLLFFFCLPPC